MAEDSKIRLYIPSLPKRISEIVTSVALLNFLFLAGTWFWLAYYRSFSDAGWEGLPAYKYFATQLNLGNENVLASWYSSMLILLLASISVICFVVDRKRQESGFNFYLNYGWIAIAFMFVALSFDELGSFHERIGILYSLKSVGNASILWEKFVKLLVGLMGGGFALWIWVVTRRYPYVLKLFLLGVMLLLFVQVFENLEPLIWEPGIGEAEINKPLVFTLFEEGAEIYSWLSFYSAFGVYSIFALRETSDRQNPSCDLQIILPLKMTFLILSGTLLALGLGMLLVQLGDLGGIAGDVGIPENWFPSVAAILTSIMCVILWNSIPNHQRLRRWLYSGVAVFGLLMSVYYGVGMPGWRSVIWASSQQMGLFLDGSLSAIALLLGALLATQVKIKGGKIAAIAWAILLTVAIFGGGRYYKSGFLDFAAFAILLPSLLFHFPAYHELGSRINYQGTTPDPYTID